MGDATDADNQYNADGMPTLLKPFAERQAWIVLGARPLQRLSIVRSSVAQRPA